MAKTITSTIVLKVSGKEVENSFNGIRSEVIRLEKGLRKLTPGTEEFKKKAAELKEARGHFEKVKKEIDLVNGRLKEAKGIVGKFRTVLGNLGLSFSDVFAGAAVGGMAKTITELLKISDAMADVQKTTGMALDEVKELWDEFDNFNTRTKKIDLLKIAEEGGRLNVPKEQMAAFVQEIDKVFVALGDSYEGGLQQIVGDIGKMKNLFKETNEQDYATAINGIGSTLNELAANGVASEKNIAGFTLRVGALPDALKPSIDKVLGLGAAFEESGVDAQIAASGYSNFVKVAGENLQSFAYSMNISYAEAQKLFNENPEEFFLRFAEGMRGVPAEQTAKIFESLKIGTLEVQKAVGAAANNTDKFRQSMYDANKALEDGSSITNEFNTKNNNAAAIWEKLKNAVSEFFTKTNMIEMFEGVIKAIGWLTGVTNEAGNGVIAFKEKMTFLWNIIKVATVAILGYNASVLITTISTGNLTKATWLSIVADKAKVAGLFLKRVALLAYNVVLGLVTFNINRATAAIIAFDVTAKANSIGVLITLITTAYIAYQSFSKEVDDATRKQKEFNAINEETNKSIISQKNELNNLLKVARDENASKEARWKAIKKLNEISPEYLGNLNLENINTQEATNAVNAYTNALYRNAKARVLQKKMDEKVEQMEDLKKKGVVEAGGQEDWLWKMTGGFMSLTPSHARNLDTDMHKQMEKWKATQSDPKVGAAYAKAMMETYGDYYEHRNKALQGLNDEITELGKEITNMMIETPDVIKPNTIAPTSGGKTNRPAKDEASKKEQDRKKDLEQSQSALEKARKEEIRIAQNLADEKLKILEENEDSEIKAQEQSRQKELTAQREHGEELLKNIKELEEKIKSAKSDEAKTNYENALKKEREAVYKNDLLMAQSEETHQKKISEIKSKYALQRHKKQVDEKQKEIELAFQKKETEIQNITSLEEAKKALLAQNHLVLTKEELRNIQTLEDAKKALREAAAREILAKEIAVMEEQKAKLKELLSDPKISPEALKKLREELEEVDSVLVRMKGQLQQKKGEDAQKAAQEENQRKKSIDILGFSAKDWEDMWANFDTTEGKIKGVIMATQALSNAFQRFARLQQALNEKEMKTFSKNQDEKKKKLLIQLNRGYISQEEYHKGIQQMEEETAEKKRKIQERAARAEKAAHLMSAIAGTASAVVAALGQFPFTPANIAMASIVGALGAVQVATIAAQPIPEFAEGGFTGLGSGKPDRTGFRPVGIVHENEYVTPEWMLQNPVVADVVDWMESIRTGRINLPKGYADGGYTMQEAGGNKQEAKNQPPTANSQLPNAYSVKLTAVLDDVKDLLTHLKENGVEAWMVEDAENGKRLKRTIKKFEKIENKNRIK